MEIDSFDLDLNSTTLVLKLDLDIVKCMFVLKMEFLASAVKKS